MAKYLEEVGFKNASIINYHQKSATGTVENYLGFSFTSQGTGFADRYDLPANTVDVGILRDVLKTLIKNLGKNPSS